VPSTVLGLPLHPLVVHAAVVLVPLAALLLIATAASARVRRWAGWLTPALATIALILVPLATSSGENLEGALGDSPLVETHADMGEQLLPWATAVAVLSFALTWWDRRSATASAGRGGSRGVAAVLAVLAVVAGIGASVEVALIGHSGAKAVWSQQAATSGGQGDGDDH
jgi:hypothetical protein